MLAHQPSCAHATRHRHTGMHTHGHTRPRVCRLAVWNWIHVSYNRQAKQEACSRQRTPNQTNGVCSRPPMPVRRKRSVRFRIGFLPGAGGYRWVPYIRAHAACNATQRRPRRSIPTRHCIGKITCSRHGGAAFGLRCTRELCVLRSCEDPRPGSARARHGVGVRVRPNREEAAI